MNMFVQFILMQVSFAEVTRTSAEKASCKEVLHNKFDLDFTGATAAEGSDMFAQGGCLIENVSIEKHKLRITVLDDEEFIKKNCANKSNDMSNKPKCSAKNGFVIVYLSPECKVDIQLQILDESKKPVDSKDQITYYTFYDLDGDDDGGLEFITSVTTPRSVFAPETAKLDLHELANGVYEIKSQKGGVSARDMTIDKLSQDQKDRTVTLLYKDESAVSMTLEARGGYRRFMIGGISKAMIPGCELCADFECPEGSTPNYKLMCSDPNGKKDDGAECSEDRCCKINEESHFDF